MTPKNIGNGLSNTDETKCILELLLMFFFIVNFMEQKYNLDSKLNLKKLPPFRMQIFGIAVINTKKMNQLH